MKCDEVREHLLGEYLDWELDEITRRGVDGHLADCQECRQFMSTLLETAVVPFRDAEEAEVPSQVWENVRAAAAAVAPRPGAGFPALWQARSLLFAPAVLALGLLLVAVAGLALRFGAGSAPEIANPVCSSAKAATWLEAEGFGCFDTRYYKVGTSIEEAFSTGGQERAGDVSGYV